MLWSWPNTRGPSFSLMPKRMTICLAVAVTFSMSFEAPVVISSKTISSAARPPRVIAIVSVSAARVPAGDDRDLVDRVGVLEVVAHDRVSHLVVGRDQALLLAHDPGLLLRAGDHAHDPLLQLGLRDLTLAVAGGEEGGLVDEVRQVGAGEAGRLPRERVDVDLLRQRLAARVDLEDLRAALAVRAIDDDLAVEAARAQERRVEDVRPVRGGDQDDVVLHLEAVHLDEQLVERLLALVVTTAEAGAAMAADRVD